MPPEFRRGTDRSQTCTQRQAYPRRSKQPIRVRRASEQPRYNIQVAIEKGDAEWNSKVQEVFAQLKQDGTLSKLSQKWIGADISQ
ncbi:transporter substrate-binding domain-containing protein [Pseudomonas sp. D4-18]|uniref:transporter substrate-binding domain-containing protein n=1 Tax=Pseudomonas sp. D4-18 TaxID=2817395 RepID=UPI003DA96307